MRETDAAYLAGLLDGEGSYMIRRTKNTSGNDMWEAVISMSTTDNVLTRRAKEIAGGYISGPTRPKQPNARPALIWFLKGRAVGPTIETMWPYISLKRPQAALLYRLRAITYLGARPGSKGVCAFTDTDHHIRETMRLACKAFNHRGTALLPEEHFLAVESANLLDLIRAPHQKAQGVDYCPDS